MGLYLASEILKEQSGRLTVRNNPQGGATFTIWLPADEKAGEEKAASGVGFEFQTFLFLARHI